MSALLRTDEKDFVVITQGFREVMIIAPSRHKKDVTEILGAYPAFTQNKLFAATVHFSIDYLRVPNIVYALLTSLAVRQVNFVEIVSTATELSIIVGEDDIEIVTQSLQKFLLN